MSSFKDHFSAGAAITRPIARAIRSPRGRLAAACPAPGRRARRRLRHGQLAVLLAERFGKVIATDASAAQIESRDAAPRVAYRVAPAGGSGLPEASVDLVAAAQAAHWFDLPAFYAEARRVARPGAILALVTYGVLHLEPPLDRGGDPAFLPGRRSAPTGRRSAGTSRRAIATSICRSRDRAPPLAIEVEWRRAEFLGYVKTWSAVRALEKSAGRGSVAAFARDIAALGPTPTDAAPCASPSPSAPAGSNEAPFSSPRSRGEADAPLLRKACSRRRSRGNANRKEKARRRGPFRSGPWPFSTAGRRPSGAGCVAPRSSKLGRPVEAVAGPRNPTRPAPPPGLCRRSR